jgi:Icc-related predicted phosphoesterase
MIKIWHISDTHTYHELLDIPDVDIVIFSGDCSNPSNPYYNEPEVRKFIEWFGGLKIPHKIAIGGNHDTSIEKRLVRLEDFTKAGIIYLENNSIEVSGLKIWGSPITPEFGVGWAWNRKREKMYKVWDSIPDDTDIIVTHGPPKTIMDLSYDKNYKLEFCGCSNLFKRVLTIKPKAVLFGHIHNNEGIYNAGIRKILNLETIFSNGSVVTDGKFGVLSSQGNIIEV